MRNKLNKMKKNFKKAIEGPTIMLVMLAIGAIIVIAGFVLARNMNNNLGTQTNQMTNQLTNHVTELGNIR